VLANKVGYLVVMIGNPGCQDHMVPIVEEAVEVDYPESVVLGQPDHF
jgi:hypothetical protein